MKLELQKLLGIEKVKSQAEIAAERAAERAALEAFLEEVRLEGDVFSCMCETCKFRIYRVNGAGVDVHQQHARMAATVVYYTMKKKSPYSLEELMARLVRLESNDFIYHLTMTP